MLPLLALSGVNWKRVAGAGAVAGLIAILAYVRLQGIALEQAELAYKNPKRVEITRTVKVQGPVRIVTRTIREPGGREEITREEVRGAVVTTRDTDFRVEPVFPPAARTSGWVGGIGADGWAPWVVEDLAAYGGYRFFGRLDVLGRYQVGGKAGAVLLWRF